MAYSLEKGLIIFLTSMLALAAVSFLSPFVGPFLLALLLAALIDQPANWLEKLGLPRGLAVLLLLAGLAVLVAGSLILVVLNVVQDVNQLAEKLPEFRYEVLTKIVWLNQLVAELPPPVYDLIRSSTSQLAQTLELLVGGFFAAGRQSSPLLAQTRCRAQSWHLCWDGWLCASASPARRRLSCLMYRKPADLRNALCLVARHAGRHIGHHPAHGSWHSVRSFGGVAMAHWKQGGGGGVGN
jgi:hypothetical protein